ncbi:MAG: hypothetical protein WCY34_01070 [Candidatus Omnitrophota bacterium]|jgi:hypothetical protein
MIPNYKEIIDLVKKGATIEAQEKIMELREFAMKLQEENIELRKKIKKLEKHLDDSQKMKFDGKFYYIEGEEYPYCPGCWGVNKRKTHLVICDFGSNTQYKCPASDCKFEHFMDNSHWKPPRYAEDDGTWMSH